ncbi:MAG: GEVED domain-containing protein [Flavobacteriales bacterium]|nr:GEVED domain-containing protein [Flavobacteriales bacterium]
MNTHLRYFLSKLLFSLLFGFIADSVWGQGTNTYTFAQTSGTYTAISGTQIIASGIDDGNSAATNIGFPFRMGGTTFTQFVANSNGHIRLGATGTTGQYTPISTGTNTFAVSGYGRDGAATGGVFVETQGAAPDRVCIIQYTNYRVQYNNSANTMNFQIRLYEGTNVIQIVYGTSARNATYTGQVGIRGLNVAADYNNRTTTTNWAATTAGGANNATITWSSTVGPSSGQTYTWTPPTANYRYYMYNLNFGSTNWCAGETRTVTLDIKNTGTSTWTNSSPDINVGVKWNTNGASWNDYFVRTDAGNVAPGASATYSLTITASNATAGPTYSTPLAAGTNNLTFDMVNEGNCWFGSNPGTCGSGTSTMNMLLVSPTITISGFLFDSRCYCSTSFASNSGDTRIDNVTFNTINQTNTTGCQTYTNNTSINTNVTQLQTYPLSVTIGTCGGNFTKYASAWIDWNRNGVFESGEIVMNNLGGGNGTQTLTANVTVPITASPGPTVMRVIGYEGAQPGVCSAYSYGETEDYSVTIVAAPPCSGTPSAGSISISNIQGCAGSAQTLTGSGFTTGFTGLTYQWQSSPDGLSGWTTIGTVPATQAINPSATTFYRLRVHCSNSGIESFSNVVSFTVVPCFNMTSNQQFITSCGAIIFDSGGPSGNYSNNESRIFVIRPTSSDQVITLSGTFSGIETCCDRLRIDFGEDTDVNTSTWEYGTTGSGSFSHTSPGPGIPMVVKFTSDISVTGAGYEINVSCSCASPSAVTVSAPNITTCGGTSNITFSNPVSSSIIHPWVMTTFEGNSLPASPTSYFNGSGTQAITGEYCRLTTATNSQTGSLVFDNPGLNGNEFLAYFTLFAGNGGGADGLSFSFGPGIANNPGGSETGVGNGLSISFDSFNNGAGQFPNCNGTNLQNIYLLFNGSVLACYTNSNTSFWRGANQLIDLYISPTGVLSLIVGGTVVFTGVQLPAGYTTADKSNWRVAFSARTGGVNDEHRIDDINIFFGNQFQYSIDNGAIWSTTPTFTGLAAGDYNLRVRHREATCGWWSQQVSITAPPSIPAVPVVSNNGPICPDLTTNVTASGLAPGGQAVSMNNIAGNGIAGTAHTGVLNNHTMEFWVKPNRTIALHSEINVGISGNLGAPTTEYAFAINPNQFGGSGCTPANVGTGISVGTNGIEVVQHGPCHFPVTLSFPTSVSGWTHVAVVHNSNVPSLYINGNLVKTGLSSVYPTFPNTSSGGYGYGYFSGEIDNIRVWNTARTPAQIRDNMYLENPQNNSGLIQHFPLNGNGNATVGANTAVTGTYINPDYYTYTWSGTGAPSASVNETQTTGTLANAGNTVVTYPLNVTATGGGCSGAASSNTNITVNPRPAFTANLVTTTPLCSNGNARIDIPTTQTGVVYKLRSNTTDVETFTSVGNPITFHTLNLTADNSTYNVHAENAFNCTTLVNLPLITVSPTLSTLSNNGDNRTCYLYRNNAFVEFRSSNGHIVAINPGNEDLGNVTAMSYVEAPVAVQACGTYQPWFQSAAMGRHWTIVPENQPAGNVDVRLYYNDSEYLALQTSANSNANPDDDVLLHTDLDLSKYSNPGNPSVVDGDHINNCGTGGTTTLHQQSANGVGNAVVGTLPGTTRYVTFSIPSFSEFWLGATNDVNPLPIVLQSFTAECDKGMVKLNWITASEINNELFLIDRSTNLVEWEEVTTVAGAGNSNAPLSYIAVDDRPLNGLSYYRLTQRDYDGTTEIFEPISIVCYSDGDGNSMLVFPNPAEDYFTVSVNMAVQIINADLEIYDLNGKRILNRNVNLEKGTTEFTFDRANMNPGTYIIQLRSDKVSLNPIKLIIR